MKKTLVIALMMVFSFGLISGGALKSEAFASSDKKEPFKIGLNFGFTGYLGMAAQEMLKSIEYYFDEIGYEVNGRKIVIVKEDNGSDPAKALVKAKKLVEIDKINLMYGPIGGAGAYAVGSYMQKTGTTYLAGLTTQKLLDFGGGKNLFIAFGTYEQFGEKLGEYLYHDFGARTASAMYIDYEDIGSLVGGAVRAFEKAGGKLIQTQKLAPHAMDFTPYIINLKKADILFFWHEPPTVPAFLTNYLQSGKKARIAIPANGICSEHPLNQVGDITIGILGNELWTPLLENDMTRNFVKGFKKKHGFVPGLGWTGYSAMQVVTAAIKGAGGDISREAINSAMRNVKAETLIGEISFLPSGGTVADMKAMEVVKVNDKRLSWKVVKEYKQVRMGPAK